MKDRAGKTSWKKERLGSTSQVCDLVVAQHPDVEEFHVRFDALLSWNSLINLEQGGPHFHSANDVVSPDRDYAGKRKLWGKRHH